MHLIPRFLAMPLKRDRAGEAGEARCELRLEGADLGPAPTQTPRQGADLAGHMLDGLLGQLPGPDAQGREARRQDAALPEGHCVAGIVLLVVIAAGAEVDATNAAGRGLFKQAVQQEQAR